MWNTWGGRDPHRRSRFHCKCEHTSLCWYPLQLKYSKTSIMVHSHRRSEYLDLPDRPNSATKLDQVFGRGSTQLKVTSARQLMDHSRSTQDPSRLLQDHLPTSTRPISTRQAQLFFDFYPTFTRPCTGTIAAR